MYLVAYLDYLVSFTLNNITLLLLSYTCFSYRNTKNNAILYLRLEQTSTPSSEYLQNFENSKLFKVIQGHRSWCQSKAQGEGPSARKTPPSPSCGFRRVFYLESFDRSRCSVTRRCCSRFSIGGDQTLPARLRTRRVLVTVSMIIFHGTRVQKSSAAFGLTRYAVSTTVRFHRFKAPQKFSKLLT